MASLFFHSMYNKRIIRLGLCDQIQNDQGLGEGYQPKPLDSLDNPTSILITPDITKTLTRYCLIVSFAFLGMKIQMMTLTLKKWN